MTGGSCSTTVRTWPVWCTTYSSIVMAPPLLAKTSASADPTSASRRWTSSACSRRVPGPGSPSRVAAMGWNIVESAAPPGMSNRTGPLPVMS
ncbi:hypothetical protein ILP97_05000 [Amycolatopsis sp. H6(2020)]|nr:hypothetical protein [Amycolatopsis sp. H6(2020)]